MKTQPYDVHLPPFAVEERISLRALEDRPYSWGVDFLKVKEVEPDGTGVIAFIIDTEDGGIDHEAVNHAIERDYCKRFTSEPPTTQTGHGHGLHVADTVLQVAPGVKIAFLKVLSNSGGGYSTDVAAGIRFVADLQLKPEHEGFVKIINLSLGSDVASKVIEDSIIYARSKGVEVFAAAGNDGRDVDFPGGFAEQVITIAAIDDMGRPAGFSSPGPEVDLALPGVSIAGAYKSSYAILSGTSMATPHAAAIAALVHSQTRDLQAFLKRYATDIHEPGKDDKTGYGIPFAPNYFGNPSEPEPVDPGDGVPAWVWWSIGGVVVLGIALYLIL